MRNAWLKRAASENPNRYAISPICRTDCVASHSASRLRSNLALRMKSAGVVAASANRLYR
ncbi:hypothetical protein D3C81_2143180 [compost metagenome]